MYTNNYVHYYVKNALFKLNFSIYANKNTQMLSR